MKDEAATKQEVLKFIDRHGPSIWPGVWPSVVLDYLERRLKKSEVRSRALLHEMVEEGTLIRDPTGRLWIKETYDSWIAERDHNDRLFAAVNDRLAAVGVKVLGRQAYSSAQIVIDTESLARWLGITETI